MEASRKRAGGDVEDLFAGKRVRLEKTTAVPVAAAAKKPRSLTVDEFLKIENPTYSDLMKLSMTELEKSFKQTDFGCLSSPIVKVRLPLPAKHRHFSLTTVLSITNRP